MRPPDNAAAGKGTQSKLVQGTTAADSAPAGAIGEYIESVVSAVAAPTSGQFGDITSITLTPGDWDVSALIEFDANGATVTTWKYGISQTSGNSSVGLVDGSNYTYALPPTAGQPTVGGALPSYRVNVSAGTTLYLKIATSYTVATPRSYARLSARRVR